jgi:hypothetical protein
MSKCIVSFSSFGRENYPKAQLRLIRSIKDAGWDGKIIMQSLDGYVDEYLGVKIELGKYPCSQKYNLQNNHSEIPYAFKPEIIQVAIERGADQVIWCDSTILLEKHPVVCLAWAEKYGVAAFENLGHPLKKYVSDVCLEMQNITEEELDKIPQIMACCIIFDFTNENGVRAFEEWVKASRDGVSFQNYGSEREGFVTHKHDQSVISLILWKLGIPLLPYGTLVYHPHNETGEYGHGYEFVNKGI